MHRPTDKYKITDIDLAAAIFTETGITPNCLLYPENALVVFEFPNDERVRTVVLHYSAGTLLQLVHRFAKNRAWLFRAMKYVKSQAEEVRGRD